MDRQIVYPGAIPLDTDLLNAQRNTLVAVGALIRACLGTGTVTDGLACTATSPASMTVNIGAGSITQLGVVDSTAFGSLGTDGDALMRMGINLEAVPFTLTAPGTSGQSINYLIEGTLTESDGTPVSLPYYNAANPAQPYTGPNNSGVAQNTVRQQRVGLQLKAGAAANAGSQVTPAVDPGYVGLWIVTVNYGQTTVTSSSIAQHPGNPMLTTKLPNFRQKLSSNLTLYVSPTGSDSNTGTSAIAPFATLQGAWNSIVSSYDLNGFTITVNLANGTYTSGLYAAGAVVGNTQGAAGISFVGNTGSPGSVVVSSTSGPCFGAANGAAFSVNGVTVAAANNTPGGGGCGIFAGYGSTVSYANVVFSTCSQYQVWANAGGTITWTSSCSVTGPAQAHLAAQTGGSIGVTGGVVLTLSGTPAFSTAFALAGLCGVLNAAGITFSGGASGSRYLANQNGVIATNSGNPSYFPGSAAGSTATGGEFT